MGASEPVTSINFLTAQILMRGLPDAAWVKDCSGAYIACSPAFEQLLGVAVEDILGKTDRNLVGAAQADALRTQELAALASAKATVCELEMTLPGGLRVLLETTMTPLHVDGRALGIVCVARDISARRVAREALRASEARNSSLVAALTEGVVLIGADGRIETCNPGAQRILGMPQQEMVGLVEPTQLWQPIGEDGRPPSPVPAPAQSARRPASRNAVYGDRRAPAQRRTDLDCDECTSRSSPRTRRRAGRSGRSRSSTSLSGVRSKSNCASSRSRRAEPAQRGHYRSARARRVRERSISGMHRLPAWKKSSVRSCSRNLWQDEANHGALWNALEKRLELGRRAR